MISPYAITIDISGLPAVVQSWSTTFDNAVQTWTPGQDRKDITYQWSALNGYTQAKHNALLALLNEYRRLGWIIHVNARSNTTQFTLHIERPAAG